jgi:hypothetical protein
MEKQSNPQLELFSQAGESAGLRQEARNPFLARIRSHEKILLSIIAVLTTAIIAFSLGVERGKRAVLNELRKPLVLSRSQAPAALPQVIVRREEAVKQVTVAFPRQPGSYTIQVASFKTRVNAQKEAEFLKKKGFTASIFNKGAYVILCVGNFPDKEAAQPLLAELNKRYGSCSIRRL